MSVIRFTPCLRTTGIDQVEGEQGDSTLLDGRIMLVLHHDIDVSVTIRLRLFSRVLLSARLPLIEIVTWHGLASLLCIRP